MADSPLVFVHGWATDSWVWEDVARGFGARATNIDLPGHGGKGAWDTPDLAPAVRSIDEAVSVIGDRRPVGVGWSLGSMALVAAQATSSPFRALVLVGSTPCFVARDGFPWGQSRALVKRMIMDMKKDPASTVDRFYGLNFTDAEKGSVKARAMMERYAFPGPVSCEGEVPGCFPSFRYADMTTALEALYSTDLRGLLERVDVPVLLVHGSDDEICHLGAARHMAGRMAGARLEVIEGAGHAPHLTRTEEFMPTINDFISTV